MKKLLISFISIFLIAAFCNIYAQEELFENPGFETWKSGPLGDEAVEWEINFSATSKESTIKKSGDFSARITGSNLAKLNQEVSSSFVQGDIYELVINYYIITSQGNNDVQLQSYWDGIDVEDPQADRLIQNYTGTSDWQSQTIRTTVPKGATKFYFVAKVPQGAEVVFDDFSFKRTESTEPYLNVSPLTIPKVSTIVGTPVNMQKVNLSYGNLPNPLDIEIRGSNAAHFSFTENQINTYTKEITITYNPTAAATNHTAILAIDCLGAEILYTSISLQGSATDPTAIPTITTNQTTPIELTAVAGKQSFKEFLVSSENITDYLFARITGETGGTLILSNTTLTKNQANVPLKVTFSPKTEGNYSGTIEIYSKGAQSVFINVSGISTGGTDPEKEGDEYPLDPSNPLILLNEKFDNITHNTPLSITGWKNIAEVNYRAWWGYDFNQFKGVDEKTAKVTAFNSTNTAADPYEMWLITPPLDFKNSASKMFTFRVMGELMIENSDPVLELYYMDMEEDDLYKSKIDMPMPSMPDQNGEWMEFHLNLEGQNLADVFFMGFRFAATGGLENSVVYYIDDVTYGRTDIPAIAPSTQTIELRTKPNVPVTSEVINITTTNLAEPITITVGGANPSKFETSVQTLPVTGGSFTVTFDSDLLGLHEAYLKLSSRGAADVYILIAALTTNDEVGIGFNEKAPVVWSESGKILISSDENLKATVYTLSGTKLCEYNHTIGISEIQVNTGKGVYIVQIQKANSSVNIKTVVD